MKRRRLYYKRSYIQEFKHKSSWGQSQKTQHRYKQSGNSNSASKRPSYSYSHSKYTGLFVRQNMLKHLKKVCDCGGVIDDDGEFGQVIQRQGDHRKFLFNFLISEKTVPEENMGVDG